MTHSPAQRTPAWVARILSTPKHWWRRAGGYFLGVLVPWAILAQLYGLATAGRTSPGGLAGYLVGFAAFSTVVLVSAVFTRNGQPPIYRFTRLRLVDRNGEPAMMVRVALRGFAHLLDALPFGLGFLWPIWDRRGQTFADKLCGTVVRRIDE
ncbi:MAG: RDD family protein [Propioniciclava sp.]|uniref:RDD family protein n=1 Tax=Propioniciclava sp. TaxID=2038686 RepID=UPI0039E3BE93